MAPELIYCASGNPRFAAAAVAAGWLYGVRFPTQRPYFAVYFADQDWKAPDRVAYMRCLAQHRPALATVLDLECERQLPEVLSWAEEAAQHVRRVVIIPKEPDLVGRLPRRVNGADVVLGYSVPTSYGGTTVPVWEFRGWPVHLLGGSPQRQMELMGYLSVVSVDGSMAAQQAQRCRTWRRHPGPKGHWEQLREAGDGRTAGANLEAFRRSCTAILAAWQDRRF